MFRVKVLLLSLLAVLAVGAIASSSASALVWEECLSEKVGTGTKYDNGRCNSHNNIVQPFEWMPIEKALNVISKGGVQKLIIGSTPSIIVTCKKLLDEGTIEPEGKDTVTKSILHECTINISGCSVVKSPGQPNGLIAQALLRSKLETLLPSGRIDDVFESALESGTIFVLETGKKEKEGKAEGACGAFPIKVEVRGTYRATVEGEALKFEGSGTLTALGLETKYEGEDQQELENGNAFRAQ